MNQSPRACCKKFAKNFTYFIFAIFTYLGMQFRVRRSVDYVNFFLKYTSPK